MDQIKHILLATDGSNGALKAASHARQLALACNAAVSIVTVHNEDALVLPGMLAAALPGSAPFTPFPKKDVQKLVETAAEQDTLKPTAEALGELASNPKHVQLWGHAVQRICDYARENAIDLIVIGSRGRSSFEQNLLGGVSLQVVTHAPCAVLVAR